MKIFKRVLFLIVLCLGGVASAFAAPTVSITSGGNGVFVLQASGLQSIGGVHIILNYDTTTLANPRVTKGPLASGASMVLNTNTPGVINMPVAAANGFPESGVIATINFDLIGKAPGVIPSLRANVSDMNYKTFPARIINPFTTAQTTDSTADASGDSDKTAKTDTTTTTDMAATTDTAATTTSRASSGTVAADAGAIELVAGATPSAPTEDAQAGSTRSASEVAQGTEAPANETPASETAGHNSATATAAPGESEPQPQKSRLAEDKAPSQVAYKSVVEEFRTFTGQKTPKSLADLFTAPPPGVRQEPVIALSDGTSKLRLFITPRSTGSAPNFSLSEAKLVSLKLGPDGAWIVEVLPAKGSYRGALTVIQGGAQTVIPLVVAPPLPGGGNGRLTDSGFAQFLADRGTDQAPRFDLNGDGKRDYLDDYIFTANYLVRKGGEPGKSGGAAPQKKSATGGAK